VQGEFAKSKATRTRILEAAIACLADTGYAATSTNSVAAAAGMTRAALLYHFPSRAALIEAVIHFVTRRRVEMQEEYCRSLPQDEQYPARSIDGLWEQLHTREFRAFAELSIAARTSRGLARMFRPAMEAFDRSRREMLLKLAQPHIASEPGFDLRRDITRFLMEGLAQQDGITFNREQRMRELFGFLHVLYTDKRLDPVFADIVAGADSPHP
jgi:AcrR family transcriptional regulator